MADPAAATGGGINNRAALGFTDAGWQILKTNFQRHLTQIDAESTSGAWWQIDDTVYYYHAKEHLCEFAKEYFLEEKQRKKWIDNQCEALLSKTPEEVVEVLKSLSYQKKTEQSKINKLVHNTSKTNAVQDFQRKGIVDWFWGSRISSQSLSTKI